MRRVTYTHRGRAEVRAVQGIVRTAGVDVVCSDRREALALSVARPTVSYMRADLQPTNAYLAEMKLAWLLFEQEVRARFSRPKNSRFATSLFTFTVNLDADTLNSCFDASSPR